MIKIRTNSGDVIYITKIECEDTEEEILFLKERTESGTKLRFLNSSQVESMQFESLEAAEKFFVNDWPIMSLSDWAQTRGR